MTEPRKLDVLKAPLRETTLIEASAGTGKTHTIATLYVRLLLEKGLAVSEILVVTYTKAATAELRQRVRERVAQALEALEHALAAADGGRASALQDHDHDPTLIALAEWSIARGRAAEDRVRLLNALRSFDEAAIFTIHGFCQRVLTQLAFETRAAWDTELVTDQRVLIDEVVYDYWAKELYDSSSAFAAHARANKIAPTELMRLASRAVADPDLVISPDFEPADAAALLAEANAKGAVSGELLDRALLAFKSSFVRYVRAELPRRKTQRGVLGFDDLLLSLRAAIDGPRGERLVQEIRTRYPAALIDEFQDTDPVQCRVFERIYDPHEKAPLALFLIGDPKQAIYGFRGADVFAYMRAAEQAATRRFTLPTNHRSDPSLVRAVNTLWSRARAPFWFSEIRFQPVDTPDDARDRLGGTLLGKPPLEILFVPRPAADEPKKGKKKPGKINKGDAGVQLPYLVAHEIVQLLHSGAQLDGQPLRPRDFAVLCRTNAQARAVQHALREASVPAVLDGDSSVFDSETAAELERVLAALCEPGTASRIRAALLTVLLGRNADDLIALEASDVGWEACVASFHRWHELWETRGVVQALYSLQDDEDVAARVLGLADGERRLTDLAHLLELLHTQALQARQGSFALLSWYRRMRGDVRFRSDMGMAAESAQIRLESDAHAVTLTTIHKSKGLAYPIVYCPFSWDGRLLQGGSGDPISYHDKQHADRLTLDHDPKHGARADHQQQAEIEALAEHLRLLYVALTRARHRVSVVWGGFKEAEKSALGYLLHQDPRAAADRLAEATCKRIDGLDDAELLSDLTALVAAADGGIALRTVTLDVTSELYRPTHLRAELVQPALPRVPRERMRASSFSRLASGTAAVTASVDDAIDLDAADEGLAAPASAADDAPQLGPQLGLALGSRIALADFPTGAVRGRLIHSIYETIDFRAKDPSALTAHVARTLTGYGMAVTAAPTLAQALARTLITRIDEAGLPELACLGPDQRLNELEFMFPVAHAEGDHGGTPLRAAALARVLREHAVTDAERVYADSVGRLGFSALQGYLRGFIDLVARHEGRFYVLDYKSNHLGSDAADYAHAPMQAAMHEHHYVLQYLLYTVAVHRYLERRVPGYDYEAHFGGAYYLFVRGMDPAHARGTGVFSARPCHALVHALSEALRSPGGVA